ncbi:MAG: phosphatase PAP2 family protein [Deltaproteobacteria bacterium]|nr:phosphatase PAP2 family protein [Deltaproteobacteria bacterium]
MHAILEVQIHSMLWLQQFHTHAIDEFFEVFSFFGGQGYSLLIPLVLWCADYRTGLKITGIMAMTLFVNTTLKNWVQAPRPFQVDPRILSPGEQGYSFPSGHAMLVVAYWGTLGAWVQRRAFWWLACAVMLLMATSRVHLGVHFPLDVTVGLLLGGITLWAFLRHQQALEAWLAAHPLAQKISVAFALGAVLFVFNALCVPDPLHEQLNVGAAGFLAGAGAGAALGLQHLSFTGRGVWWKRALRFVVGAVLSRGVLAGMRKLGISEGLIGDVLTALTLAVFGLWITFAMPWLFERIHLSD